MSSKNTKSQNVAQEVAEVSSKTPQKFLNRLNSGSKVEEAFGAYIEKLLGQVPEDSMYTPMLPTLKLGMTTSLNGINNLTKFEKAVEVVENINAQSAMLLGEDAPTIEVSSPNLEGIKVVVRWHDNTMLRDEVVELSEVAQVFEMIFNRGEETSEVPTLDAEEVAKFFTANGVVESIAQKIANYAMRQLGGKEVAERLFVIFSHKMYGGNVVPNVTATFATSVREIAIKLSALDEKEYAERMGETSEDADEVSEDAADVIASIE